MRLVSDDPGQAQAWIREAVLQPAPLLLIDRVVAQGDDWLETSFEVPLTGPLLRGDDRARVLPGTLTAEQAVQASELMIHALRGPTTAAEGVPVLTRLRHARFRGLVRPGDVVTTRVQLEDQLGPAFSIRATARVDGALVFEARLAFAATTALRAAAP
jgi:3-hydroxymyristoyl/3-hydroxydecanoyl-(acyl carrier protein) dehydratase